MFNANHYCPRDMLRADWVELYRVMRRVGERGEVCDCSELAERVELQAEIDAATVDGFIGLVESGMDCDCVSYCYGKKRKAIRAIELQRRRADQWRWADGPCWLAVCRPDELPESYSRDLALEAFEDGHPHCVTASNAL